MNLSSAIWFLVGTAATMIVLISVIGMGCYVALGLGKESMASAEKRIMRETEESK